MQIKTSKLKHTFDIGRQTEFRALKGIDTELNPNEYIAIIGHTGSGKTTYVEHLNALLKPTDGEVIIGERIIKNTKKKIKNVKELRRKVGIVFQFSEYQLFEETILKDIIFGPVTMGTPKEEAIELAKHYIQLVGLPIEFLEKSPFALSGGQKRRVALAGILAMEPEYLIFDEPTAGLDPKGQKEMYKIFEEIYSRGKTTIIIVTHDMDHVLTNTQRTLLFQKGVLLYDGPTLDIMYDEESMKKNGLELSKLASLVIDLEKQGKNIGRVRTIEELVRKI